MFCLKDFYSKINKQEKDLGLIHVENKHATSPRMYLVKHLQTGDSKSKSFATDISIKEQTETPQLWNISAAGSPLRPSKLPWFCRKHSK